MPLTKLAALILFLALSAAAATLGGYWTSLSVGDWYASLQKPTWNPPGWVFGPVWTALYILMAVAAWLVWLSRPGPERTIALGVYVTQLILNTTWSGAFFALRSPVLGMVNILLLLLLIGWTIKRFRGVSPAAAVLMIPYMGWVTFAAAINFTLWRMNS